MLFGNMIPVRSDGPTVFRSLLNSRGSCPRNLRMEQIKQDRLSPESLRQTLCEIRVDAVRRRKQSCKLVNIVVASGVLVRIGVQRGWSHRRRSAPNWRGGYSFARRQRCEAD